MSGRMARGGFTLWKRCDACGTLSNVGLSFCRDCNCALMEERRVKRLSPEVGGYDA